MLENTIYNRRRRKPCYHFHTINVRPRPSVELFMRRTSSFIKSSTYASVKFVWMNLDRPTWSVASIFAHTPVRAAEIWEKKYIFYFLKAFLSLNWDDINFSHYIGVFTHWCLYPSVSLFVVTTLMTSLFYTFLNRKH